MRQLEFKDIACYLPYDLMCVVSKWSEPQCLVGLKTNMLCFFGETGIADLCLDDIKPILHPMSDIAKEIVVEGYNDNKPFKPLEHLIDKGFKISEEVFVADTYLGDTCSVDRITYFIGLLHSWHFDTFNLIGEGLAIDINTLNKQNEDSQNT